MSIEEEDIGGNNTPRPFQADRGVLEVQEGFLVHFHCLEGLNAFANDSEEHRFVRIA